jgi:phosphatidylglycerophosphate synthase
MIKQWLSYLLAYVMWTLNLVIGVWVILISREFLVDFLGITYAGQNIGRGWQAGFLDKVYLIALGVAWLAFMIAIEDDFKKSVKKGTLMRRFTRIVGPEFLLVFLAYLGLLILQGINSVTSGCNGFSCWLN